MAARQAALAAICATLALPALGQAPAPQPYGASADGAFMACLLTLKADAVGRGIPQAVADRALGGLTPDQRVLDLDKKQPEFVLTFWRYYANSVTEERIAKGRALLQQHRALLAGITKKFGVQPEFLIAFWGLETNYGTYMGDFSILRSLVTLACDDRRPAFFAAELLEALRMIANDRINVADMKGSWAGAFGHTQFMPSTFTRHALDGDGDKRRDLFHSLPDVFNSSANYLQKSGWKAGERAVQEVRLPENFPWEEAEPTNEKPLAEWAKLGVRLVDGSPLPMGGQLVGLALPSGARGPAFLTYPNFKVIMIWNRSTLYALAVGLLAEKLAGRPGLTMAVVDNEPPLTIERVLDMQATLTKLGYYQGEADGLVGPRTRAALRQWQKSIGVPADGYPSAELLDRLLAKR